MRAVVLRDGRLEVRDTADPVWAGHGPLSRDLHRRALHDHPDSAPRFVWDSGRTPSWATSSSARLSVTARIW
jgi:hypothetical protein